MVDDLSVQLALALGPEIKTEQSGPDGTEHNNDETDDEMARPVENNENNGGNGKKKRVYTRRDS